MSARLRLQVWCVAHNGVAVTLGALCLEHAIEFGGPDYKMPPGFRTFRVKQKAVVREVLGRGTGRCTECAFRSGQSLRARCQPGVLTAAELELEGADA